MIKLFDKLKDYLATRPNYDSIAKRFGRNSVRKIEFACEERRPVPCYLPVKWMPELKKGWIRLTFEQFIEAYSLPMDETNEISDI